MSETTILELPLLEEAETRPDYTVNAGLLLIDAAFRTVPRWVQIVKTHSQLAAAASTNNIEIYSLPPGGVVHGYKTKHSQAFAGGSISAYALSIGVPGDLDRISEPFDVFQASGDTVLDAEAVFFAGSHGGATSIRLAATATGGNLNTATAGIVDVWLLVSQAE